MSMIIPTPTSRSSLEEKARINSRIVLAQRRAARQRLIKFTEFTKPDYTPAHIHEQIAAKLDAVVEGRIKRLMLFLPPRFGKTELASRRLPAYFLGKYPKKSVIAACYGDDLATEFGRDVRNCVASKAYHALFPHVTLAADSQSKGHWHTNEGGAYLSAGIGLGAGTTTTGRGAHLLIIDDPVKSRVNAEQEVYREGIKSWYRAVAYTRLEKDAAIVLIQTRWHEDDLGGWLEQQEQSGGDKWDKLILSALDSNGQSIWPEKFSTEELNQKRAVIKEYEWASLYEQRPRPVEGSYFTLADMLVDNEPVDLPLSYQPDGIFAVIDSAVKTGKENDGTAVSYFAYTDQTTGRRNYPLVLLDWDITQIEGALLETWLPTVFQYMEQLAKETKARFGANAGAWIEDKSSGMILLQQAERKNLNVKPIESKLTSLGKSERAINCSGYVNQGMIKFSRRAYDRVKTYKEVTRNHMLSQVLGFRIGTKDMSQDDLLDTFTYGIALSLGNAEGF